MNEYIFYGILILMGVVMLRFYAGRKHTLRCAALGMGTGGAALLLLHYFGGYIGYAAPLNLFNTAVSLILGIPGAALIAGVGIFL